MHDANNGIIFYLKPIKAQYRVIENSMDENTEAAVLCLTQITKFYLHQIGIVTCTEQYTIYYVPEKYLYIAVLITILPKIQFEIEYFLKRKIFFSL